jgi:LemA protein
MRRVLVVLIGVVVAILGMALIAGGCVYSGYKQAVGLDEQVKSNWAQVENQLQRRYDLIPNLVETVKGVTGQEQKVFLGIAEARKAYFQADRGNIEARSQAANQVESALSRLLVLTETYPQLRSSESFQKLQDELAGTENRMSVERKRYNDSVRELNTFTRQPLGGFYARLAGVQKAQYFEVQQEAKTAPKVDFSSKPQPESSRP